MAYIGSVESRGCDVYVYEPLNDRIPLHIDGASTAMLTIAQAEQLVAMLRDAIMKARDGNG